MQHEEDVFWTLYYMMYIKGWRDIYANKSPKLAQIIKDFEAYLIAKVPEVHEHILGEAGFSIAAVFTSQFVTLFIYDLSFEEATSIFELFLLDGEQVIVDLLATFVEKKKHQILQLHEIDLMNYLRKDMVTETLAEHSIVDLLPREPKVQLTPFDG